MKILISPAKSLDFQNKVETSYSSEPLFANKAKQINNILKEIPFFVEGIITPLITLIQLFQNQHKMLDHCFSNYYYYDLTSL